MHVVYKCLSSATCTCKVETSDTCSVILLLICNIKLLFVYMCNYFSHSLQLVFKLFGRLHLLFDLLGKCHDVALLVANSAWRVWSDVDDAASATTAWLSSVLTADVLRLIEVMPWCGDIVALNNWRIWGDCCAHVGVHLPLQTLAGACSFCNLNFDWWHHGSCTSTVYVCWMSLYWEDNTICSYMQYMYVGWKVICFCFGRSCGKWVNCHLSHVDLLYMQTAEQDSSYKQASAVFPIARRSLGTTTKA